MGALPARDDIEVVAQAWKAIEAGEPLIVNKTAPGLGYLKLDGAIFLPGDAVTLAASNRVKS